MASAGRTLDHGRAHPAEPGPKFLRQPGRYHADLAPAGSGESKHVSFQAYLDNIEKRTGLTPRQFIALAHEKGLDDPAVKAGAIVDWLKDDYLLGRGHAMALVHIIKKGPQIDAKHVDSGGPHTDPSDRLWLDGKATNPGGVGG